MLLRLWKPGKFVEKTLSALTLCVVMFIIRNDSVGVQGERFSLYTDAVFCTKEKHYDDFHDWNRPRPCAG